MLFAQVKRSKVFLAKTPVVSAEQSRSFLTFSGAQMKSMAFIVAPIAIRKLTRNKNCFFGTHFNGCRFSFCIYKKFEFLKKYIYKRHILWYNIKNRRIFDKNRR